MSLDQLRANLLADIHMSASEREIPKRLHVIYERTIKNEVVHAIRREISKDHKFNQMIQRIPNINLVRKITNKLAKVYNKPASRKTKGGTDADQKLIDFYAELFSLNSKMGSANKLLELMRSCCLELYMGKDGKPKLRVLANYQVRAYNGNPDDPLEITAITKLMGVTSVPDLGSKTPGALKNIEHFQTTSADEFMIWNNEGLVSVVSNPIGRMPYVWVNSSEYILNPYAPESDIDDAVLVPKYYADLFYAMAFNAHSMTVGIDLNLPDTIASDPGAWLDLKTDTDTDVPGKQGRIEVVKPEIKIDEALALIKQAVNDMLESRGIVPPQSASGSLERPNASAAIIEAADASSHILQRCSFFYTVEAELWSLIKHMHNNYWLKMDNTIDETAPFSPTFKVDVLFGEVKPVEIRAETLANIKAQRDMGLMSDKQALEDMYPQFTDAQVDAWLEEAKKDAAKIAAANAPTAGPTAGGGPGSNTQNPTKNPTGA